MCIRDRRYIIYREWRNVERDRRSSIKGVMDGIVTVEKNDINLSNANMSSHTCLALIDSPLSFPMERCILPSFRSLSENPGPER